MGIAATRLIPLSFPEVRKGWRQPIFVGRIRDMGFVGRVLAFLLSLIFAALGIMTNVTPEQAESNLSAWFSNPPPWLRAPSIDIWGELLFFSLAVVMFLFFAWPWISPFIHRNNGRAGPRDQIGPSDDELKERARINRQMLYSHLDQLPSQTSVEMLRAEAELVKQKRLQHKQDLKEIELRHKIATENPRLHYTVEKKGDDLTLYIQQGQEPQAAKVTALRIIPQKMELLDSTNVQSVSSVGHNRLNIVFAVPIDPAHTNSEVVSSYTLVPLITATNANIEFDPEKTSVIEVRFKSGSGD